MNMMKALFSADYSAEAIESAFSGSGSLVVTGREPYGDSVRLRKKNQFPTPQHMYLVYVGMRNNELFATQVSEPIDPTQLDLEQDRLITQARNGQNLAGRDFQTIIFGEPSYFSIVIDVAGWEFYYPFPNQSELNDPDTHDPIIFTSSKRMIIGGQQVTVPATRNRSFYDLEPIRPTIGGIQREGIRCINFFKRNEAGEDIWDDEILFYSFNLLLRVPFSSVAPGRKVVVIIDPDGQNQGPGGGGLIARTVAQPELVA